MGGGNYSSLQSLLVGSALTFISLFIIEFLRNRIEQSGKSKNFKLYIKLELEVIIKSLEKLKTSLDYGYYYDYSILDQIKNSLSNLEKVREEVIYLADPALKEKFVDIVSDISAYQVKVRQIQELFYQDQNLATDNSVISKKTNKKVEDLRNKQDTKNKTMDDVWRDFMSRKTDASIEYVEIKRRLEELVKEIS